MKRLLLLLLLAVFSVSASAYNSTYSLEIYLKNTTANGSLATGTYDVGYVVRSGSCTGPILANYSIADGVVNGLANNTVISVAGIAQNIVYWEEYWLNGTYYGCGNTTLPNGLNNPHDLNQSAVFTFEAVNVSTTVNATEFNGGIDWSYVQNAPEIPSFNMSGYGSANYTALWYNSTNLFYSPLQWVNNVWNFTLGSLNVSVGDVVARFVNASAFYGFLNASWIQNPYWLTTWDNSSLNVNSSNSSNYSNFSEYASYSEDANYSLFGNYSSFANRSEFWDGINNPSGLRNVGTTGVTNYSGGTLNVNYNVTAQGWVKGRFNFSANYPELSFDGYVLGLNTTQNNATISQLIAVTNKGGNVSAGTASANYLTRFENNQNITTAGAIDNGTQIQTLARSLNVTNSINQTKFFVDATTGRILLNTTVPLFDVYGNNTGLLLQADGTVGAGTVLPSLGDGAWLYWYPAKFAFRAGRHYGGAWNDANVGYGSAAFGYNTTASDDNAFAAGSNTRAESAGCVAMGVETLCDDDYGVAMGYRTHARSQAVAMGGGANATGSNSVAIGDSVVASGASSIALGTSVTASQANSLAIGWGGQTKLFMNATNFGFNTTTPWTGNVAYPNNLISAHFSTNNNLYISDNAGSGGVTLHSVNDALSANRPIELRGSFYAPTVYGETTASAANTFVASDGHLYRSTSSKKFKKEITNLSISATSDFDKMLDVSAVSYQADEKTVTDNRSWNKTFYGFIAEDLNKTGLNSLVSFDENNTPIDVDYRAVSALLWETTKQQQQQIQEMNKTLITQRQDIADLKLAFCSLNPSEPICK